VNVTKNLARSLAPEGMVVNCVCPGWVLTPWVAAHLRAMAAEAGLDTDVRIASARRATGRPLTRTWERHGTRSSAARPRDGFSATIRCARRVSIRVLWRGRHGGGRYAEAPLPPAPVLPRGRGALAYCFSPAG